MARSEENPALNSASNINKGNCHLVKLDAGCELDLKTNYVYNQLLSY